MPSQTPFTLGKNLQDSHSSRAVLHALLNGVRRQLIEDLDRLVRAVTARDCGATGRVADAVQDLADAVAANELRNAAAQLSALAREGSIEAIDEQLQALRAEAERCIAYIPVVVKGIDVPTDRKRE
jgi:N-acetylglucosamine kinase-like BadF-type ATPase